MITNQPLKEQYNRPTIALCCILKDELKNLPQMLSSVEGCFDEIHLTDTGSSDGSIEWIQKEIKQWEEVHANTANTKIILKHFAWCDDFAKARNHSMENVTTDYVMWMDLDDVLGEKERFIQWRDHVMMLADFWLAPYYYSFDQNGYPNCTFLRERVVKTSKKFSWEYFIHEGMIAKEQVNAQFVNTWQIHHKRTPEDYEKDFLRNVSMLEKAASEKELPTRLKFYYGKELFDKQRFQEAYVWLDQIVARKDLEHQDKILTYEYLIRASMNRFHQEQAHRPFDQQDKTLIAKSLSYGLQALALAPKRAELHCLVGDCFILLGQIDNAYPFFESARACKPNNPTDAAFLFTNIPAYTYVPWNQIARHKFNMGDLDGAIFEAKTALERWGHPETESLLKELLNTKERINQTKNPHKVKTNEIVISCLPGSHPYPFDEDLYKEKGMGGSETALIEVAKYLKEITQKPVIVFNGREENKICSSGVIYRTSLEMHDYFCKFEPDTHIAWRHNVKLTNAKTYLWCHDLVTPGAEMHQNYEKIICLSEFHKNYVQVQQNIPSDKIVISRNGIDITRFETDLKIQKEETKIVWPSSPDRGLNEAIAIIEKAREKSGTDFTLHVYYGFDNMKKYGGGFAQMAIALEEKIKQRPWIKYHGNLEQRKLAKELLSSSIWLYPASFIETYCITVLEAVASGVYPIVKEIGALKNTVKPFSDKEMADLLFLDVHETEKWADRVIEAFEQKKWQRVSMEGFDYSWKGVAKHFAEFMGIETESVLAEFIKDQGIEMITPIKTGAQDSFMDIGV